MDIVKVLAVAGSGTVLFMVLELIRRGRLKERYSLLWLFSGLVMLVLALSRDILEYIAHAVGIFYPPSLLFLITLHFSVIISGLSERNKKLAQEIALLRQNVEEMRSLSQSDGGTEP